MSLLLQILKRLLQQLNTTGVTVEQQLAILLELEYLVHQVRSHYTHLQLSEPPAGVEGELQHRSPSVSDKGLIGACPQL